MIDESLHLIYVIECYNNKYYVGKTFRDPVERLNEHIDGNSCSWTNINKPIKIIDIIKSNSNFTEDNITKQYMIKYGIDNVRGGSYSNVCLTSWQRLALQKEFLTVQNKCYKCHEKGHISPRCINKKRKFFFVDNEDNSVINNIVANNNVSNINNDDNDNNNDDNDKKQKNNLILKLDFFFKLTNISLDVNLVVKDDDDFKKHKNIISLMLDEIIGYIKRSYTNSIFYTTDKSHYVKNYEYKALVIKIILFYNDIKND